MAPRETRGVAGRECPESPRCSGPPPHTIDTPGLTSFPEADLGPGLECRKLLWEVIPGSLSGEGPAVDY